MLTIMFHFILRLKLGTLQSSPPTCCLSPSNCIERKKFLLLLLLWPPHPWSQHCSNMLQTEDDASHGNTEGVVESFLLECGLLKVEVMIYMG